jgi:hypothetical protein
MGEHGEIRIPELEVAKICKLSDEAKAALEKKDLTVDLIALRPLHEKSKTRDELYNRIVSDTIGIIQKHVDLHKASSGETTCLPGIAIEGYSYDSQNSSHYVQLCELGGVLRHQITLHGWSYQEIAPARVKKLFTGDGDVDKYLMLQRFLQWQIIPNFLCEIGCPPDYHVPLKVPNPIQDVVDSFAVLHASLFPVVIPSRKKKASKRGRSKTENAQDATTTTLGKRRAKSSPSASSGCTKQRRKPSVESDAALHTASIPGPVIQSTILGN